MLAGAGAPAIHTTALPPAVFAERSTAVLAVALPSVVLVWAIGEGGRASTVPLAAAVIALVPGSAG